MMSFGIELLASILSPQRCAACDTPVARLVAFCPACRSTVEPARESDVRSMAAFVYGGAIAHVIRRLKYERRADLANPLGDLVWRAMAPCAGEFRGAIVIPVPLHPSRLVERGYNQATLIARRLALRLDAPFRPLGLARVRDTPQQAALDREARRKNVADAFRVRRQESVHDQSILLVDDVCTTGATLEACTRALMHAGAARVTHAVVARALRDDTGA
jgi:ComF family protein